MSIRKNRKLPRTPAVADAVHLLRAELLTCGTSLGGLGVEDAWQAFLRFGRTPFDTPGTPDSDGLLFQYGTYAFDGPTQFLLDFVRQFEIVDDTGEHDHYVQVHCEARFTPVLALRDLGSFNSWFFHDSEADLDEWAAGLTTARAWSTVSAHHPDEVVVYLDDAC